MMYLDDALQIFMRKISKAYLLENTIKNLDMINESRTEEESIQLSVIANLPLKHAFAKFVANGILNNEIPAFQIQDINDQRLKSFVYYYLWTGILTDSEFEKNRAIEFCENAGCFELDDGIWLPGLILNCRKEDSLQPVTVYAANKSWTGCYRDFRINLLCFNSEKCLLGVRADSGPIKSVKPIKGIKSVGIRKDVSGREWMTMEIDYKLTDDYTAVIGTYIDGEGTLEIADIVSLADVRILTRFNF